MIKGGFWRWFTASVVVAIELAVGLTLAPFAPLAWQRDLLYLGTALAAIFVFVAFSQLGLLWVRATAQAEEAERLREEADRRRALLETLHEAAVAVRSKEAYPDVLRQIVGLAVRLAGATYGALSEFDEQEQVVNFVTVGVADDIRDRIGLPPTHRGLLRRLSVDERPLRLSNVQVETDFSGFPKEHPHFRTFLGVPLYWQGELVGHLYLGGHHGEEPFSAEEEQLLEMFGMHAAAAIARARLLRDQAAVVRAAERREIAMELHDGALQTLYAVGIQLDRSRRLQMASVPDPGSLDLVLEAVQQAMDAIRRVLDDLDQTPAPAIVDQLRLATHQMAELYGIKLTWQGLALAKEMPGGWASDLSMLIAEAVSNAGRHGRASEVLVCLERSGNTIRLTVDDNGIGLSDVSGAGRGLGNLSRRAQRLGGVATLEARPEGGARVAVELPCDPPLPNPSQEASR
jgi:signal transduction histidine kinase